MPECDFFPPVLIYCEIKIIMSRIFFYIRAIFYFLPIAHKERQCSRVSYAIYVYLRESA